MFIFYFIPEGIYTRSGPAPEGVGQHVSPGGPAAGDKPLMEFIPQTEKEAEEDGPSPATAGRPVGPVGLHDSGGQKAEDPVFEKMVELVRGKKVRWLNKETGLGGKIKNDPAIKEPGYQYRPAVSAERCGGEGLGCDGPFRRSTFYIFQNRRGRVPPGFRPTSSLPRNRFPFWRPDPRPWISG